MQTLKADIDWQLVDQLVYYYYNYDPDCTRGEGLSPHEVKNTIAVTLAKERIQTVVENKQLVGYVESWRLDYEQFGRLLCSRDFDVGLEDIQHGPILYLANVTVRPDYKNTWVIRNLRDQLFHKNLDATYFLGEALRKKTQPVKIFETAKLRSASRWASADRQQVHRV